MFRILYAFLFVLCGCQVGLAQNFLPIGQWRTHFPYQYGQYVAQSAEEVFFASNVSIMVLDKEERSTRFITRVDGLSGNDLKLLSYVQGAEMLMVVYQSSVIDLVSDEGIRTLPQIRNFTNLSGARSVNDVYVADGNSVYLAGSYGLSKLDVAEGKFVFTTFTGIPVNRVVVFDQAIYAATDEGIYRTSVNTAIPDDFTNWELLGSAEGFPETYSTRVMAVYNDRLYLDIDDVLHRFEGGALTPIHQEPGHRLQYLSAEGRHLLIGYRCASSACGSGKMLYFDETENLQTAASGCLGVPNYAVEDPQGRVWFGDEWFFFRVLNNLADPICEYISINGPYFENAWQISIYNDQVWVAAGGLDQTLSNTFNDRGFFSLIDGQWTLYNRYNREEMRGENPDPTTTAGRSDDLFDILNVQVSPDGSKVYAGSYYEGLMELTTADDALKLYNEKNSPLQTAAGDLQRVRIGGMAFDAQGDLWIANHSASGGQPIVRLSKSGEWKAFGGNCGRTALFQVAVDANGYKWFTVQEGGLLVFDEGDPDNPADDRCRILTASTNSSNLPSNDARCVVADRDGDIWAGTSAGVAVFQCGTAAFDAQCVGTRPFVERDGFGANLLSTEIVNTIAVDGANRKWVGTANGVYLLSPNGRDELARFTVLNSPLPDNNIRGITVNQRTGEVFFATSRGIVSYQGDAVAGTSVNSTDIEVFPNPVQPHYRGAIIVRGLALDATVKITDVSGRLVYETTALGGQATWDGTDYNGRRANTGVYLVFSTSNSRFAGLDNPSVAVAKILFVN